MSNEILCANILLLDNFWHTCIQSKWFTTEQPYLLATFGIVRIWPLYIYLLYRQGEVHAKSVKSDDWSVLIGHARLNVDDLERQKHSLKVGLNCLQFLLSNILLHCKFCIWLTIFGAVQILLHICITIWCWQEWVCI